uniref:Uncharacterized protein n=1 Tax=Salix viminalis TaxID=40686 RepID=A0A6N2L600_SALVM
MFFQLIFLKNILIKKQISKSKQNLCSLFPFAFRDCTVRKRCPTVSLTIIKYLVAIIFVHGFPGLGC